MERKKGEPDAGPRGPKLAKPHIVQSAGVSFKVRAGEMTGTASDDRIDEKLRPI